jgi:release factor glutamine methyltransferase
MTLQETLNHASTRILRRDAELLLAHALRKDRTWLFLHHNDAITPGDHTAFQSLVERRAAHEPLQYIIGKQEFFGLSLQVSPATLIPRPETEHLVEAVLAWAATQPPDLRLVDVGTGTGAIPLALAKHLPSARIFACDISPAALQVARTNAINLGLEHRVHFWHSDLLQVFTTEPMQQERFHAIVSNPPYIPAGDAAELQPEVRDFEPHVALFAGDNGLEVYCRLIPQAAAALRPGGLLAMEFGFGQRDALTRLLSGWKDVRFVEDYAGIPRIVLATRHPS